MDTLKFELESYQFHGGIEDCDIVKIIINGQPLTEISKELTSHVYISPEELYLELTKYCKLEGFVGNTALAGCSCGCTECNQLSVRVEETDNLVVWYDFLSNEDKCDIGPFVFDKVQYYQELKKLYFWACEDFRRGEQPFLELDTEEHGIEDGFMFIKFWNRKENCCLKLDEDLSDIVPSLVKAYNYLKVNQGYAFEDSRLHYCAKYKFETKIIENDKEDRVNIKLNIEYEEYDESTEECYLKTFILDEVLARDECLTIFEKFFSDIYTHPRYPFHFPCYSYLSEELSNDLDADDKIELFKDYESYTDEGCELWNKYNQMLTKGIIPYGWKA